MLSCTKDRNLKIFTLFSLLAVTLLSGCEDERPAFEEPTLSPAEVVTLTGIQGCYITEMDGARVACPAAETVAGGNSIKIEPGEHEFRLHFQIYALAPAGMVNPATLLKPDDSSSLHEDNNWWLRYTFKAGHHYHFTGGNPFHILPVLTDETTKQEHVFEEDDDITPRDY